jgi:hexosaminidase
MTMNCIIPKPFSIEPAGDAFVLTATTQILVEPATSELSQVGRYLAGKLRPATGFTLPVAAAAGGAATSQITLTLRGGEPSLGPEGYTLSVTPDQVTLTAIQPAGLFRGVQTLRQLLPPAIESASPQAGPWTVPTGVIRDKPRFAWRGVMLDVARHFFGVDQVKRYIDLLAQYKISRLHLGLANDQGWRLMIQSWPKLALYGGSTAVGGGRGGFYTQADYTELAAYAQSRYMTLIPELDMPGHIQAALASYPELNPGGVAPALFTGTKVGFSTLAIHADITWRFLQDVIGEVAALTPGPYLHIGGDEAWSTPLADYVAFIDRLQPLVEAQGKQMIGWDEICSARLGPSVIVQKWRIDPKLPAARADVKYILSPADRAYLDMKYNVGTPLGQDWAGFVDLPEAYTWDPARDFAGLTEDNVLGIEAALWTETLETMADVEFMTFPRLPGLAEIGWSEAAGRSWDEYRQRLGCHVARLRAGGVNFYRSAALP